MFTFTTLLQLCVFYICLRLYRLVIRMDFARKQLEKYGWRDGKGLGKHENGISQALKPKLKRSVAGIGYDAAADFTEHWWSALYDKAAKNVEVQDKNGKTKKIKTNDEFEITNSTWRIKKKKKKDDQSEKEYSDFFVQTATLNGDEAKIRKANVSDDERETKDVFQLTDEQLFAACEGRTAHKGARHGLKALGKLARIEQQEKILLTQTRYKGYSHAKNEQQDIDVQVFEDINLDSDPNVGTASKKKKKKKKCNSFNNSNDNCKSKTVITIENESEIVVVSEKKKKRCNSENEAMQDDDFDTTKTNKKKKKRKNSDCINYNHVSENDSCPYIDVNLTKTKKKKIKQDK